MMMKSYLHYVHSPSSTVHHTLVILSRIIIVKIINLTVRTSKRSESTDNICCCSLVSLTDNSGESSENTCHPHLIVKTVPIQ